MPKEEKTGLTIREDGAKTLFAGNQITSPSHPTLMSPNKSETAVCGPTILGGVSGEGNHELSLARASPLRLPLPLLADTIILA